MLSNTISSWLFFFFFLFLLPVKLKLFYFEAFGSGAGRLPTLQHAALHSPHVMQPGGLGGAVCCAAPWKEPATTPGLYVESIIIFYLIEKLCLQPKVSSRLPDVFVDDFQDPNNLVDATEKEQMRDL